MKSNKAVTFILLLGLVLRLFVSHFQYSGDVKNHVAWAGGFVSNPHGFYNQKFPGFNDPNYPPLAIYFFSFSKVVYEAAKSGTLWLNNFEVFPSALVPFILSENTLIAFYKLPAIIADLLLGLLLYLYLKKQNNKQALLWTSFLVFNPALIYVSAVWGQIESLTILFLCLSLASFQKRSSLIYFSLAVLTKQTALWVLPLYLLIWLKNLSPKKLIQASLLASLVFFFSYLPFGLAPIGAIKNYLATLSGSSTVVSDAAWNLWHFVYKEGTDDSVFLLFTTVRNLSVGLLILSLLPTLAQLVKLKNISDYAALLSIWSALVFFLQTRVHERHFYPSLIFLYFTNLNSKYKFLLLIILSSFFLANLYDSLKLPFI